MQIDELIDLGRAQLVRPGNWSLATDARWLGQTYMDPGVSSRTWRSPTGVLLAIAAVQVSPSGRADVTVTSMLRPGAEDLWNEQRTWIDARLDGQSDARPVTAVCESLTDAEAARWQAAGYDLVFEEIAMAHVVTTGSPPALPRWPSGTTIVEWPDAARASSELYVAAFRDRPGFPGWTPDVWIERITPDEGLLPAASFCALIDGAAAGFVVCEPGWVAQVGVAPAFRRRGLARALATEAIRRQRALGHETVFLHVNTNNSGALATWRGLGFEPVGRRGRFERRAIPR
jgi:mycothiol synthase